MGDDDDDGDEQSTAITEVLPLSSFIKNPKAKQAKKKFKKEESKETSTSTSRMLGLFTTDPPPLLELDQGNFEWVEIDTVVDSGAADPVMGTEVADWLPIDDSPGSLRGQTWVSATNDEVHNLGQRKVHGFDDLGNPVESVYQIGDTISTTLGAVSRTCDKGNRVVFEKTGGYIENLDTGVVRTFPRVNNIYVMKTWVKKPVGAKRWEPPASSGFARQGR